MTKGQILLQSWSCKIVFFGFFISASFTSASQKDASNGSQIYQKALNNLIHYYKNQSGSSLLIFNGVDHYHLPRRAYGSRYWIADSLIFGTVQYDGIVYDSMLMKYDLVAQKLVVLDTLKNVQIELADQKVEHFNLSEASFYRIEWDEKKPDDMVTGFYNKLNSGRITIWAARSKRFEAPAKAEDQTGTYKESNKYYIEVNQIFYAANSKSDLQKLFKKVDEGLNKLIKARKNRKDFEWEKMLTQVAQYHEQLAN
jgi:hypothetical protein